MPAVPRSAAAARSDLRAWWAETGAPPGRVGDVALAVTEAVANAVVHAYPGGEEGEVRLRLCMVDAEARVSVRDFGTGMRPAAGDTPHFGLELIRRLADAVEVSDVHPGTLVQMRFRIG